MLNEHHIEASNVHGTQLRKNYRLGSCHEECGAEAAQLSLALLCDPTNKQIILGLEGRRSWFSVD